MHDMAICSAGGDLMQCYTLQTKRGNIWDIFPALGSYGYTEPEGESSMFIWLGVMVKHFDHIFGFVSFF